MAGPIVGQKELFIDGNWVSASGPVFQSANPATTAIVWEGHSATAGDIDAAVVVGRQAFRDWALMPIEQRKEYLEKFAKEVEKHKATLARLISEETGKPLWESLTEVAAVVNKVAISIHAFDERCRQVEAPMGQAVRHTRFKPHGVVAVLGPFNLPAHLPNGHIVPALLAGNTVVFKPSERTPAVGHFLVKMWAATGIPSGVVNLIQGGKEAGLLLASHAQINGLFFTGSAAAGKALHQVFAGQPEKILTLEMGGNNPLIVFDVEDMDAAAYMTVLSAFITSGQRCVCARRLIVPEGKKTEHFIETLVMQTMRLRVGPYTDVPEPFMGPVINREAGEWLMQAQKGLALRGGKIIARMDAKANNPAMLMPGIMDTTHIARRDEELFGPFLQVIRVKNFDAALEEANHTQYGLAAGLISDNPAYFKKFYALSRAGILTWNRQMTGASSEAPFGGVGKSGNHRPSAYFAADYCSYPVASIESEKVQMPPQSPGIN